MQQEVIISTKSKICTNKQLCGNYLSPVLRKFALDKENSEQLIQQ